MVYTVFNRICLSALLLGSLVLNQSCSASKKYLVNEWKVQKFQSGTDFSESPQHVKLFEEFEKTARFRFNADGTYVFDMPVEKQVGKWKLDKKTMTLTTTSETDKVTVSKIAELTADKLVLEQVGTDSVKNVIILVPKEGEE